MQAIARTTTRIEPLTFKRISARPVVLKLQRPVVARIATITDWPLILIDLYTEEGIVGRSYLEPYTIKTMKYLIPALHDFGVLLKGRPVAPIEMYDLARKSLHFVGYQGMSMIAVAGLDMAAWDALSKAAGMPLCVLLGGSTGPVRAYNKALQRCHMIDDLGLDWIEEPIVYDNFDGYAQLTAELKTPIQIGENFYGPRDLHRALQMKACDYVMPDFMRIGGVTGWLKASGIAGAAGVPMSTHLYPEVAAHVMRVTETAHWLEWQDWADPILQRPFALENGQLNIPNEPGVGLEWDEAAVSRCQAQL